jgi:hypothetical protein
MQPEDAPCRGERVPHLHQLIHCLCCLYTYALFHVSRTRSAGQDGTAVTRVTYIQRVLDSNPGRERTIMTEDLSLQDVYLLSTCTTGDVHKNLSKDGFN